jgi:hypothetical protein
MTWYLRTRYEDARRAEVRVRQYLDSGEVWFVVDGERSLRCRFNPSQVAAARAAVFAAGLADLSDIPAREADLATMIYEWALPATAGRWVNAAYPQVLPETVDDLEETLLRLEESAE